MKPFILTFFFLALVQSCQQQSPWCDPPLRAELAALKAVETNSDWFEVFEVGTGVYAIAEPYNFQEVISYLILGDSKALLFDTGMGMASIHNLVKTLTGLPVTVINSHTHYDHIGGNHEFDEILAMDTEFTHSRAANGMNHSTVALEVDQKAFCEARLPGFDKEAYHIKPFKISQYISHNQEIDLGNRTLKVVAVPGHTVDAIALLDEANGYLWTGDTYYEGPIWLFDEGTDLQAYGESVALLANLASGLEKVFPAHNLPISKPQRLIELNDAFKAVMHGEKAPLPQKREAFTEMDPVTFEFEHFSIMIRGNLLPPELKN